MEPQNITMLNNLNPLSNNYTLKLKIVSLWRKMMHGRPSETYRVDMICMDEEGHQIQASCMHRILPRLQEYFKLDECLLITRPSLAPNNSTYNYTKNTQKLTFSFFTQIQKSQDWNGPKYNFSFVNFKDVVHNRLEVNTTVDFIGYVEVCFNLEDTNKKDGTKGKRLNVKLKDLENHQIIGTLWDEFAIRMHAYFNAENREKYVVMVVHFGVVNLYKGKRGLSTSFDISRIFIDTDIDEITTFRQSLIEKFFSSPSLSDNFGSYLISSVEDEFMNNSDFMPTVYLGNISEPKKVMLVGTVTAICSDKIWYYNACNHCKSGVEEAFVTAEKEDSSVDVEHKTTLICTNKDCQGVDIFSIPRFKIPIRVQDSSGTVTLTLFDFEAYKIFKKTAKELLQVQDEELANGGIPKPYPDVFDILIGKKLAFIISVSNFNIKYKVENYGIHMATSDPDIISALYTKFKIHQDDQSESSGVHLFEIQSVSCEVSKDDVSYTGDNETPVSNVMKSNQKSPSTREVKRNLHEVYDVDDTVGSSSSKRRASVENHEVQDSDSLKRLIPKMEK